VNNFQQMIHDWAAMTLEIVDTAVCTQPQGIKRACPRCQGECILRFGRSTRAFFWQHPDRPCIHTERRMRPVFFTEASEALAGGPSYERMPEPHPEDLEPCPPLGTAEWKQHWYRWHRRHGL
jgi:hypothetical protein